MGCQPFLNLPLDKKWSFPVFGFLRIWSHLLKKSLMEKFIFCAAYIYDQSEVSRSVIYIVNFE